MSSTVPEANPDFSRDVVVEQHILAVVGATPRTLSVPPWSVWVARTVVSRVDSRDEALTEGKRLAPSLKCDLWLCEDGKNYERLGQYSSELASDQPPERC